MWNLAESVVSVVGRVLAVLWRRLYARLFCTFICDYRVPTYQPARWNDGGFVQSHNNCYNYGCNQRNNTFAQPGYASGIPGEPAPTCAGVTQRAIADGLISHPCHTACTRRCCHPVALVIWPGVDYHWYRLDTGGSWWSHKPGPTPATNLDESTAMISDPAVANRGPYTEYCGCFCRCTCTVKSLRGVYPPS